MNEFLAEMYGTRDNIGAPSNDAEVEKMAEAQLLDEALQAEGIDIDQLPGETIVKLAHQLLGEDSQIVKEAAAEGDMDESFEEKVAQADFLGRVMAHSYVDEMTGMDKEAKGEAVFKAKLLGKKLLSKTKKLPGRLGKQVERLGKGVTELYAGKGSAARMHPRTAKLIGGGTVGAGTAAGAGAAYGTKKLMEKKNSALDSLAEKRAMEWAAEHGLLDDGEETKLAAAVDQRAYELLLENGIDVDAIESQ